MDQRYDSGALRAFAENVLGRAGLPPEPAEAVARGLVEGDLYGHVTHGLALLEDYVAAIETGTMERDGRPEVLADAGAELRVVAPEICPELLALAGEDAHRRLARHHLAEGFAGERHKAG